MCPRLSGASVAPRARPSAGSGSPGDEAESARYGAFLCSRILERDGIVLLSDLGTGAVVGMAKLVDAAIGAWSARRTAAGGRHSLTADSQQIGVI